MTEEEAWPGLSGHAIAKVRGKQVSRPSWERRNAPEGSILQDGSLHPALQETGEKQMQLKFFATYRQISGCKECAIPAPSDVLELLHDVSERWPAFRTLVLDAEGSDRGEDVIILVNGRHIEHLEGMHTKLTDDDTVAITPVVAGG
ncbi:MAG: MoaD family protein [Eggerthellaceae bacterium]|nr:MoaD family protein [Eggerthellaceae bacterium]